MPRTPDGLRLALLAAAALLLLAACGASDGTPYIPGDEDETPLDGDADSEWNPGDYDPDNGCSGEGDGECSGQPESGLDCTTGPCVFGQCRKSGGVGVCVCQAGYAGNLCDRCAEGFEPQGLRCVQTGGVCRDLCLYGLCRVINEQPICECSEGYAGDRCDQCAPGYHEANLRCLPD